MMSTLGRLLLRCCCLLLVAFAVLSVHQPAGADEIGKLLSGLSSGEDAEDSLLRLAKRGGFSDTRVRGKLRLAEGDLRITFWFSATEVAVKDDDIVGVQATIRNVSARSIVLIPAPLYIEPSFRRGARATFELEPLQDTDRPFKRAKFLRPGEEMVLRRTIPGAGIRLNVRAQEELALHLEVLALNDGLLSSAPTAIKDCPDAVTIGSWDDKITLLSRAPRRVSREVLAGDNGKQPETRLTIWPDKSPICEFEGIRLTDGAFIRDGVARFWYPCGQQRAKVRYQRGDRHGSIVVWDREGKKLYKGGYFEGRRAGMWVYYSPDGSVSHAALARAEDEDSAPVTGDPQAAGKGSATEEK